MAAKNNNRMNSFDNTLSCKELIEVFQNLCKTNPTESEFFKGCISYVEENQEMLDSMSGEESYDLLCELIGC